MRACITRGKDSVPVSSRLFLLFVRAPYAKSPSVCPLEPGWCPRESIENLSRSWHPRRSLVQSKVQRERVQRAEGAPLRGAHDQLGEKKPRREGHRACRGCPAGFGSGQPRRAPSAAHEFSGRSEEPAGQFRDSPKGKFLDKFLTLAAPPQCAWTPGPPMAYLSPCDLGTAPHWGRRPGARAARGPRTSASSVEPQHHLAAFPVPVSGPGAPLSLLPSLIQPSNLALCPQKHPPLRKHPLKLAGSPRTLRCKNPLQGFSCHSHTSPLAPLNAHALGRK